MIRIRNTVISKTLTCLLTLIGLIVFSQTASANNASVSFGGTIAPSNPDSNVSVYHRTLVSFTDQVALPLPNSFGSADKLRVYDASGKLQMESYTAKVLSGQSAKIIQMVKLSNSAHQMFMLCNGLKCIQYNVIRL